MDVINFLTNDIRIDLIFKGIDLILGIELCFFVYRFRLQIIARLLAIKWGEVLGGLLGYVIYENLIFVCLGTAIGVLFFLTISELRKSNGRFIIGFVFGTKIVYLFLKCVTIVLDVDLTFIIKGTRNAIDYYWKNTNTVIFIVALSLGLFFGIFMTVKKINNEKVIMMCIFIGATQLVGILASNPETILWSDREWQDLFIPMLSIGYSSVESIFAVVVVTIGCIVGQRVRMQKKGNNSENKYVRK